MMFKRMKLRFNDIRMIGKLIPGADKEANKMGEEEAGAEHFLLSALRLPDGTASRIFDRIGVDASQFQNAIKKQYSDALNTIGIDTSLIDNDPQPVNSDRVFKNSQPSGQAVMKALYELKKNDKDKPLLSAHVIAVVARMEYGVTARALNAIGIDRNTLIDVVEDELKSIQH